MDLVTLLVVFFFIGGALTAAITVGAELKKHRPVKPAACADLYLVAEETRMTTTEDAFLRTHTSRVKVASNKPKGR